MQYHAIIQCHAVNPTVNQRQDVVQHRVKQDGRFLRKHVAWAKYGEIGKSLEIFCYSWRRANYFRIFFLIRFRNYFWIPASLLFLLFLFLCFPAFPASLLFCFFSFLLLLLLAFSAFLLFCFPCSTASLLFCFFAFLFFLFLCFSAFPAFPASLLFCFSCFFAFLLFCFCAFPVSLLLCFFASLLFFALPALNTWFSCKMHFAQYLHPWVSHDQPSLEN